eukprot:5542157-Pleurochrysis_carterae.AAC.1
MSNPDRFLHNGAHSPTFDVLERARSGACAIRSALASRRARADAVPSQLVPALLDNLSCADPESVQNSAQLLGSLLDGTVGARRRCSFARACARPNRRGTH